MRGLKIAGILAATALVFVANASRVKAADAVKPANCTLKQYASVDFIYNDRSQILVPVTVEGAPAPSYVLLETSGSIGSIPEQVVEELNLKTRPWDETRAEIHHGSERVTKTAIVPSIKIGGGGNKKT